MQIPFLQRNNINVARLLFERNKAMLSAVVLVEERNRALSLQAQALADRAHALEQGDIIHKRLEQEIANLRAVEYERAMLALRLAKVENSADALRHRLEELQAPLYEAADEDAGFAEIWNFCAPHTMTSFERGLALYRSVRHIVKNNIPGAFVECGVWRGGSSMIAMMTLAQLGDTNRRFFLFDTFEGMTEPTENDRDFAGNPAKVLLDLKVTQKTTDKIWCYSELEEVTSNIAKTGYPLALVKFVKGDVRKTLAETPTGLLALLRLDTDFYDSTLAELTALYPRLAKNGVLIVDDYGYWQGARKAVIEYFSAMPISQEQAFFQRIDFTGRLHVRTVQSDLERESRYDYIPPGLVDASLLPLFPELIVTDPNIISWEYFRKDSPHTWRTDSRNTKDDITGVLTHEEAALLHNNALLFRGLEGLEIGCHFGWSAAQILAAGLHLSIIDPSLHWPEQYTAVDASLAKVSKGAVSYHLLAGYSPAMIPIAATLHPKPWSFVFIDGDHSGEAPLLDAKAVSECCAADAFVMFHDVNAPNIAEALRFFRTCGWQIGIYNTMQIMGVAWRGKVAPARHIADPRMPKIDQPYLLDLPLLSE